jgi:Fe-S oxidoreductase
LTGERKMSKYEPPNMNDVFACLQCGYCKGVCPVASVKGWESFSPRGKVYWMKRLNGRNVMDRLFDKKIELDKKFMTRLFSCTLCGRCEEVCHVDIPFIDFWEKARQWLVRSGYGPPDAAKMMYKSVFDKTKMNPFNEPADKRDEWYKDKYKLPRQAEYLYFPGCVSSYYEYSLLLNDMKIMKSAELDFTTLGKREMCCGALNWMMGAPKHFKRIVDHNIKLFRRKNVDTIVTNCPGCLGAFSRYREYNKNFDFRVLHTTELYQELLQDNKLKFKKEFKAKNLPVIYHDPCELGRLHGVFEPPRELLANIPGITDVKEFPTNRSQSVCCGGGGGLKALDFELAEAIVVDKVDMIIDAEATTVVSSCPNCKIHMSSGISTKKEKMKNNGGRKLKLKAMDISEVLGKAIV